MSGCGDHPDFDESVLHALVDGELSPERAAEVEAYLTAHPDRQALVAEWRAQKASLKAALDPVLAETSPPEILSPRRATTARRAPSALLQLAASLVLLLLGTGLGYGLRPLGGAGVGPTSGGMDQAFGAHAVYSVERRHPIEVSADERDHLNAWLSNRLGRQIAAPDLSAQGYELLGGRLLAASDQPAALFMYQNAVGDRATLLMLATEAADQDYSVERRGALTAVVWARGGLRAALVGASPPEVLESAARDIENL